jgi:16S rRNA (uracil1498-N3)-methyltransferase
MPDVDFTSTRLHVAGPLTGGASVPLAPDQLNYLANVLRLADGDGLLAFDGVSGEWRARFRRLSKKAGALEILDQTRPQPPPGDIWYLFAPLKHARLDYMVQKATEMGAARLVPVLTRRTQATRVNLERMRANVVEAAEQCGVLNVPPVADEIRLEALLDGWDATRRIVFCDEAAPVGDPVVALRAIPPGPLAALIGPEGGFDPGERARLLAMPCVIPVSLGPRILRADTAAVAILTIVQAVLGDWQPSARVG